MDTAKDHLPILSSQRYRSLLLGHGWTLAVYLTAIMIAAFPVLATEIPGLVDYLNHLARIHILANLGHSPELQGIYSIGWPPPPNVLGDLVLLAFNQVFGIYLAGRLYLLLCFALIIAGLLLLTKTLQARIGYWPLAGFLLLYNANLDYGFLNYLLSLGLLLIAFALWLRSRQLTLRRRLVLLSCTSLIIFYAHLFGLATLIFLIAFYEIGAAVRDCRERGWTGRHLILRQWLGFGLALTPVLVLLVFSQNPAGEGGRIVHGGWAHKILVLLSPVGMGLDWLDPLTLACLLIPLIILVIKGRLIASMRPVLAGVLLAAIVMPHSLGGDSWFVDFRIPILLLLLTLAAIDSEPSGLGQRIILVLTLLGLITVRSLFIQEKWSLNQARIQELMAIAPNIDKGSSLLTVRKEPISPLSQPNLIEQLKTTDSDRYDWHLATLFIIEREAFTPTIFTGMNLLRLQEKYTGLKISAGKPITPKIFMDPQWLTTTKINYQGKTIDAYWGRWPEHFDYVLLLNDRWERNPYPRLLKQIHQGSFFQLYRISRSAIPKYR